MATISKLVVSLEANSAKLVKSLASSRKRFKKWAKSAASSVKSVAKAFTVISIGAVAGFIVAINRSAAAIDSLAKTSSKLGFPIEDYQRLAYVADLSGVSMDKFGKSIQRMMKTIGDARDGLSTATKAFDALGLNWDELANMSPADQFTKISEAMATLPTQADRIKTAMDIFGKSGADLLNLFKSDVKGAIKEFDGLGIAITASQAKAVEAFNDSKNTLGKLISGITDNVTATLAPAMTLIVKKTKNWIKEFGGGKKVAAVVAKWVVKGISAMIKGFGELSQIIRRFEIDLLDLQALWLTVAENFKFSADYDELDRQLQALGDQRNELVVKLAGKNEFLAEVESLAKEVEATVKVALDEDGAASKLKDDPKVKADIAAAAAAEHLAQTLKQVGESKVWNDIFKKEEVTARSNQFDDVARKVKEGIESGSAYTVDSLKRLGDILQAAKNNPLVFSNNNQFEKVDIKGMAQVVDALKAMAEKAPVNEAVKVQEIQWGAVIDAEKASSQAMSLAAEKIAGSNNESNVKLNEFITKLNSKPTFGNLNVQFTTDTGKVAGEIFAEPGFINKLKEFSDRQRQEGTRADSA